MDIDLIRTFVQVAKTSHFRKAADQLYLTPSAVSARIKQLEERLGTQLFERNKHQVSLTTSGVRFLTHAENLLAAWNRACHEVRLPDQSVSVMVVGATDTLWNIFLADWLMEMKEKNPELMLWAELHTASSLMPALLDGSLDIAVMFDVPALPRLQIEELAKVPLVMVSSSQGLQAGQESFNDYIDVDWGEAAAASIQQHFDDRLKSFMHTSVGKVALQVILKSGGTAYLPLPMVAAYLESGELFRVEDAPVINRPVYAATLSDNENEPLVAEAINLMRSCLDRKVKGL